MIVRKKLILLRHATAEMGFDANDRERNLTPLGQSEAESTGRKILATSDNWKPDLILSSDATRARQTLEGLCRGMNYDGDIIFRDTFYSCSPQEVLDSGLETKDHISCLLLLGHNPTWSDLIGLLSGQARALAPANAALLSCESDSWAGALAPALWSLDVLLTP